MQELPMEAESHLLFLSRSFNIILIRVVILMFEKNKRSFCTKISIYVEASIQKEVNITIISW